MYDIIFIRILVYKSFNSRIFWGICDHFLRKCLSIHSVCWQCSQLLFLLLERAPSPVDKIQHGCLICFGHKRPSCLSCLIILGHNFQECWITDWLIDWLSMALWPILHNLSGLWSCWEGSLSVQVIWRENATVVSIEGGWLGQVTTGFSAPESQKEKQRSLYVTERPTFFRRSPSGSSMSCQARSSISFNHSRSPSPFKQCGFPAQLRLSMIEVFILTLPASFNTGKPWLMGSHHQAIVRWWTSYTQWR